MTRLIHAAFEVWSRRGLNLSPMRQSEAETAAYMSSAFVAEDSRQRLVGTFALGEARLSRVVDGVVFAESGSAPVVFAAPVGLGDLPERAAVFKKAAVRPDEAKAGIGALLYTTAESLARERGFPALALETVREADWLYAWYLGLGFRVIGSRRYAGSSLETVLMLKVL